MPTMKDDFTDTTVPWDIAMSSVRGLGGGLECRYEGGELNYNNSESPSFTHHT